MRWLAITCESTRHIIPAQQHLWKKYLPGIELQYIDLGAKDVTVWCTNVLDELNKFDDEYIVLGLDDYLPMGPIDMERFALAEEVCRRGSFDRFDLGWGPGKNKGWHEFFLSGDSEVIQPIPYLLCGPNTSYSCSVQFSIWRLKSLKELFNAHGSPWHFEVKGECKAGAFKQPVFRWLESSALSEKRWPKKTNVLGLKKEDILEILPLLKYPLKDAI
jgi:hypothetical protein